MAQTAREEVVIVAGARTGIGTFGGQFAEVPAAQLGAVAIKAAVARRHWVQVCR